MSNSSMPGRPDRAGVSLKVIVVGGSIAGLAAAYVLGKAGHEVVVLEKSDGKGRIAGGLRCPPNMTKLLHQWGLEPTLDRIAQQCLRIDWYSGATADPLGSMVVDEDFLKDLVTGFLFIQHGELQSSLIKLAEQEGVVFRFDSRVLSADSESGSVLLQTGEQVYGDIIIGADGYDSIMRQIVAGEKEDKAGREKHLILAFNIPANILREDEELRSLTDPSLWSFWIGEDHIVHANILNEGRDYTVTISHFYEGPLGEGPEEDWKTIHDVTEYGIDLGKLEPRIKKLLGYATTISSRIVFTRPCVENLICENSRMMLVGDAAHPILPSGHHSQALSLEDAETLGCLFSRIQRKDQVSRLLTAYNEIRQPWCVFAVEHSYRNQAMLKAKKGPFQEARDARMRATLVQMEGEHMDEALFKEVWGNELAFFAHDAREKVEDWWGQWGSSIVRNPNRHSILSSVAISISKDIS